MAELFNSRPGGATKSIVGQTVFGDPEHNPQGVLNFMRLHPDIWERTVAVLKQGGEYIYGWAETLSQHYQEAYKRAKRELGRLKVDEAMLIEQVKERPDALALQRRLAGVRARLTAIEFELVERADLLKQLGVTVRRAA
jgi:hypothetical protein